MLDVLFDGLWKSNVGIHHRASSSRSISQVARLA